MGKELLPELVSRIRENIRGLNYLSGLENHFNYIYTKLKIEGAFARDPVFNKIYTLVKNGLAPDKKESEEFKTMYGTGLMVFAELGSLNEGNKNVFFEKVVEMTNFEKGSFLKELKTDVMNKKSYAEFEDYDFKYSI